MAAVVLVSSRALSDYQPLFEDLAPILGDRFANSIANWCGIGERPYSLAYWDVMLVQVGIQNVGVASLYRRVEDAPTTCWIGWFGLAAHARRRGYGRRTLELLEQNAREQHALELRVYTDVDNETALRVYTRAGFVIVSERATATSGRAADPSGTVLVKRLAPQSSH